MVWTNSDVLALASLKCSRCDGTGFCRKADGSSSGAPCRCVLREVFRACLNRFRECVEKPKCLSITSLTRTSGPQGGRQVWGRKNEEFIADFQCIARRTLRPRTFEYTLFRYHYLLGADENLIFRQLRIEKDVFFNARERIIQKLGKAFRETEPFSLYPLDEYFSSLITRSGAVPATLVPEDHFEPVRPPLKKAA